METDKIGVLLELICLVGIAVILFGFRVDIYNLLLPLMAFNGQIDYRGYSTAVMLSIFIPLFLIAVMGILLHFLFSKIRSRLKMQPLLRIV